MSSAVAAGSASSAVMVNDVLTVAPLTPVSLAYLALNRLGSRGPVRVSGIVMGCNTPSRPTLAPSGPRLDQSVPPTVTSDKEVKALNPPPVRRDHCASTAADRAKRSIVSAGHPVGLRLHFWTLFTRIVS